MYSMSAYRTPKRARLDVGGAGAGLGARMGRGTRVIRNGESGKGTHWRHRSSVVRLRPTADARLVYRQLALGLMNWCMIETVTGCRLTGTTNQQFVRTLSQNTKDFLEAHYVSNTRMQSMLGLHRAMRDSYTFGNGNTAVVRDDTFAPTASGTTVTVGVSPNVRQTWDLGTCWQYRDYVAHAYGLANGSGLGTTTTVTGYIPPHYDSATTTHNAMGVPDISSPAMHVYRRQLTSSDTEVGEGEADQWQNAVLRRVLEETTPLFLDYEEIRWTFTNPTEQTMDIDIYELVAAQDVPLVNTPVYKPLTTESAQSANYGRWPDPLYLFQQDLDASQVLMTAASAVPLEGVLGAEYGPAIEFDNVPAATTSVGGAAIYRQAKPRRMIYQTGMVPRGTNMALYYRVGVHRIHLDAGARATYTCRVNHRRSLGYSDLFDNFAKAGKGRQYMIVVRGERLASSMTGGPSQAQDTYRKPDVLVEWTKQAKFCRFRMKPKVAHTSLGRAIRTDIAVQYDMDPESGDFETAADVVA